MHVDKKAMKRFQAFVCPEPNTGCSLWMGTYSGRGYGAFFYGRQIGAHVFSFVAAKGEVPLGCVVHHRCNTPACVNAEHLEAVTVSENIRLGRAHARAMGRIYKTTKKSRHRDPGLAAAIEAMGTMAALGAALPDKLTPQAIFQWKRVPAERLRQISDATGLSYDVLRPDMMRAA